MLHAEYKTRTRAKIRPTNQRPVFLRMARFGLSLSAYLHTKRIVPHSLAIDLALSRWSGLAPLLGMPRLYQFCCVLQLLLCFVLCNMRHESSSPGSFMAWIGDFNGVPFRYSRVFLFGALCCAICTMQPPLKVFEWPVEEALWHSECYRARPLPCVAWEWPSPVQKY